MFRYCLKETNRIFSFRYLFSVFGIYSLYVILFYPKQDYVNFTFWEYFLSVFSSPYYFILMFQIILLYNLIKFQYPPALILLLRAQRFSTFIIARLASITIFVLLVFCAHIIITAILAVGLNANNCFSIIEGIAINSKIKLFSIYSSYFSTPVEAISVVFLYMVLGYILYSILISCLLLFLRRKIAVCIIVLGYFATLLSVQRGIDSAAPLLFLNNYILLSNAIQYKIFPWSLVISLAVCFIAVMIMSWEWSRSKLW